MTIGIGILLGGLLGACGAGSSAAGSENNATKDIPSMDKQQPGEVQTASFALG